MENSDEKMNFETLPHYLTSGFRQFLPGERHISRMVENRSILIILRKGILRFSENGAHREVTPGEYYIQRPHNYQDGPVPSDSPNYFYVSFTEAAYDKAGQLPPRGRYDPARINPLIDAMAGLSLNASSLEYESLLYSLLVELYRGQRADTVAQKIHGNGQFSLRLSLSKFKQFLKCLGIKYAYKGVKCRINRAGGDEKTGLFRGDLHKGKPLFCCHHLT